jgi:DnaJ like chaperone protein
MPDSRPIDSLLERLAQRLLSAWVRHTRKPHLEFMFAGMGRIARSSGHVTPEHIAYVEAVMRQLNLRGKHREQAIGWFRSGRDGNADLHQLAARCNAGGGGRNSRDALARMSLESFVAIAGVEPQTATNRTVHFLASLIGLDAATAQRHHRLEQKRADQIDAARATLGVAPDASLEDIKRAYRLLASRHHPDKLSTNASPDEREFALRRSIEVRAAWEFLLNCDDNARTDHAAA